MGVEVDLYVECGRKASPSRTQYRSLIEDLLFRTASLFQCGGLQLYPVTH